MRLVILELNNRFNFLYFLYIYFVLYSLNFKSKFNFGFNRFKVFSFCQQCPLVICFYHFDLDLLVVVCVFAVLYLVLAT